MHSIAHKIAACAVAGLMLTGSVFAATQSTCKSVLDYQFPELITGKPQSLCDYAGKVVLVVNTA
ncbi:MAG: glutathione peroxidase, partial [Burkholderiales bacterium]